MTGGRLRRLLQGGLLSLVVLAAAAAAAEMLWRVLKSRSWVPVSPFAVRYDPVLGWGYPPYSRVRHRTAEFDVEFRFDNAGRRGGGISPYGPPVAVFAGDSLTLGWGLAEPETFAARAGRALGLQVANLGVAGYATDQAYLRLLRDGLPLRPRLVVFTFCPNDLREVLHGRRYGRSKPQFRLEGGRLVLSPVTDRTTFLERHSVLYGSIASLRERYSAPQSADDSRLAQALVLALVRAMAAASRTAGARFVLVIYERESWLIEPLTRLEPGSVVVDAGPALARARLREGPVEFDRDPHWNGRGARVVAGEILRSLGGPPVAVPAGHPP
jgi:lysophospholipase L1-like esterase